MILDIEPYLEYPFKKENGLFPSSYDCFLLNNAYIESRINFCEKLYTEIFMEIGNQNLEIKLKNNEITFPTKTKILTLDPISLKMGHMPIFNLQKRFDNSIEIMKITYEYFLPAPIQQRISYVEDNIIKYEDRFTDRIQKTIFCTQDHQIFRVNGKRFITAKDLTLNDHVFILMAQYQQEFIPPVGFDLIKIFPRGMTFSNDLINNYISFRGNIIEKKVFPLSHNHSQEWLYGIEFKDKDSSYGFFFGNLLQKNGETVYPFNTNPQDAVREKIDEIIQ